MKRIAFFCIPAHGHTNPMLPVAAELVRRGHEVRFYSFEEFSEKIRKTGSEFVSCDRFLPQLSEEQAARIGRVSTTEMTIQDIRITLAMDGFLSEQFAAFRPDVIYSDSVCFWGKLSAWKHGVPLVISCSTFAFNQLSSRYIKNTPAELADMVLGLPRVSAELKKLKPLGYPVKSALQLVSSDNATDTVVYASRRFQPCAESFSDHYTFVGPSVFSTAAADKVKARPLVYISMGTVINERPDLYRRCAEALGGLDMDVLISCGRATDVSSLGQLPANITVRPYVDQLDVLSRADAFITHCGMNSVSESLYMATPMVLYPQTGEQHAVARRAGEMGAGVLLEDDSAAGIREAVTRVLGEAAFAAAALECSRDFRACSGPEGAADFILAAPHASDGVDRIGELNKETGLFRMKYWLAALAAICLTGVLAGWQLAWIPGVCAGALFSAAEGAARKRLYEKIIRKKRP